MIRMTSYRQRNPVVTACLMTISLLVAAGCGDGDSTNSPAGKGRLIITMHDAPVDEFSEIWLTIESATLIRAGAEAEGDGVVVPFEPLRTDFLELDSVSTILVATEVTAGGYSKLRLDVADPEFVRDDDSVFTEPDVQLVANGHIDINLQHGVRIDPDLLTVLDLDFDLESGIQITETGDHRYIMRPQALVDLSPETTMPVVLEGAMVTSFDAETGTLTIAYPGEDDVLLVYISEDTEVIASDGLPLEITALALGSTVAVEGEFNAASGTVTAFSVFVAP